MKRIVPALTTLAALFAAACIENPGVDPGVGRSGSAEKASLDARFRQGNFLQLRLSRDSGRTSLTAANTGLGSIDSAAFLLRLACPDGGLPYPPPFDPPPDLEYYGRVSGLKPGAGADLGIIDTLLPYRLSDCAKHAWVIRASEDGRRAGSAFGGVFTGRHRSMDTGGKAWEGPMRGLITADGAVRFVLYAAGSESPLGELTGSISDSGTMAPEFNLGYQNQGMAGRIFPDEAGYRGSFIFADMPQGARKRWIDSLALEFQAYSPR